jgi:hypothetical protein
MAFIDEVNLKKKPKKQKVDYSVLTEKQKKKIKTCYKMADGD